MLDMIINLHLGLEHMSLRHGATVQLYSGNTDDRGPTSWPQDYCYV